MKRVFTLILILSVSLILVWIAAIAASPEPGNPEKATPPPPPEKTEATIEVEEAIVAAMDAARKETIYFWDDSITIAGTNISGDQQWAASILVPYNRETDTSPEKEPALVITIKVDDEWQVLFPNDPLWLEAIENAPDDLLSPKHKEVYLQMNTVAAVNIPTAALGGYLLPWDDGSQNQKYLTGSTCHDEYIPSGNAHYAFDFAYNRTMWDILAVKSGEVWVWKDDVETCYEYTCFGEQSLGNYIVLRDTSTDPITYQLYLHLKQDSIPDEIKVRGYPIVQGQFIGIVDNTGQSWGSHLHFQVQVPYLGEDHYWGRSVDITFNDVDINGGRPRIHKQYYCWDFNYCDEPGDVCEESQLYYTSQNVRTGSEDSTPPEGDLLNPLTGETYTDSLPLEAWAQDLGDPGKDPIGIESAQFIAYYEGIWRDIGPSFNTLLFDYDWDWCTDDVPDGPVSVALRLRDYRGNLTPGLPGLRHVTKQYDCPPQPPEPTCEPTSGEVAIFSEINYQGACQILSTGVYTNSSSFSNVGNNNTYAIMVGSTVQAELFTEENFAGRSEIIQADDSNLGENLVGNGTLSSLKINPQTATLATTTAPEILRGRVNPESTASLETAVTAPYSDTLEGDTSGWTVSIEGWWHLSTSQSHSATHSWRYGIDATGNYDDGFRNFGFIATPVITLPVSTDPYMLQFWYRYETESHFAHWDQRWVQISVDGNPFSNVQQLTQDPMGGWMRARIDLLPYYDLAQEHTIQVRFFFDTIDEYRNSFEGWYIDDVQISAEPVSACETDNNEPNDTSLTATSISYDSNTSGAICPGWDVDFFSFNGFAGDRLVVDIEARSTGSELDSYLFLLDSDGSSELAENDDEVLYEKQDPLLSYMLPRDGQYHLKLIAWDRPMGTGEYSLNLITDHQRPSITLTHPSEDAYLPHDVITFTAEVSDGGSGIQYVQFLYHSSNWETDDWIVLATDNDDSNGWSAQLDTTAIPNGDTISVYARAYDWAGNWAYDAAWNVGIDSQAPTATIKPLDNPADSTALHLQWTATDNGSGIELVNIEYQINNGSWNRLLTDTLKSDDWFIGEANNSYAFRVFVQDQAGNEFTSDPANTNIPIVLSLCSSPDAWDVSSSNNNNSFDNATPIAVGDTAQQHNFCNPAASDRLNDQDWLAFTAEQGKRYSLVATPQGDSTAVVMRFFTANGTTLLAETIPTTFGQSTQVIWQAPSNQTVYVQLQHLDGRVAGNGVTYSVYLQDSFAFLPLIER